MSLFRKDTREMTIKKEVDTIINKMIEGHTDAELVQMVKDIESRAKAYLKFKEKSFYDDIEYIKIEISATAEAIKSIES